VLAPVASAYSTAPVVLVVEDDALQRASLVSSLGKEYTVYEACDGLAALQALAEMPRPAVIVCDANMPRMDGLTFARAIKSHERTRGIPLLMTTARTRPLDVLAGINAGVRHYLPKPIDMRDLLEKVKHDVGSAKG
jgi:CheY-like chemotaxis protein